MTIAHDVTGEGPAVVLLHSGVCDRRMWDPQWPVLAQAGHRVVRGDFRGFGDTPAGSTPYTDVADVRDLMDALGIERAALVGSSHGGRVSLEFAAQWPDRVTALALLCSGRPGHEPGPEIRAFGAREDELLEAGDVAGAVDLNVRTWLGPEATSQVREQVRQMQQRAFDLQLDAADLAQRVADPDLSAIAARSLVVSGGQDLPDFRQIAVELAELIPGASHVELAWAGHLPSLERPAGVTPLLVDFLSLR